MLQEKLLIIDQVRTLLLDGHSENKFIVDQNTRKIKISPTYLQGIQEFNLFKALVANCADKAGYVEIELLKTFIDQVYLRHRMMKIEAKVSDLDIGKTEDEILEDNLYEMSKTNPNAVESNLAEEGDILD